MWLYSGTIIESTALHAIWRLSRVQDCRLVTMKVLRAKRYQNTQGDQRGKRFGFLILSALALLLYFESSCPRARFTPVLRPIAQETKRNEYTTSPTTSQAAPVPLCARNGERAQSFLMIFMGHSGSSAIISELFAHSQVYFEGKGEPVDHWEYQFNTTRALQFTREFFRRGIAEGKTPGFKMRPRHIVENPAAWAAIAREFNTRIIWQYRDNLFKTAIGEYKLRHFNDSSVVEGLPRNMSREERCKIGAGCRFRVDDMALVHELLTGGITCDKAIASAVHQIADGRDCVFALPYEHYLYNRGDSMRRLHGFLGLRQETHAPIKFKATSDNLCDTIINWDEVCTNFYGCHSWRWMMDDARNQCYCNFKTGPITYCSRKVH